MAIESIGYVCLLTEEFHASFKTGLSVMLAKSLAPSAFFEQFCSMGLYTCTRVCVLANSNVQSTRVPGNLSYVRLRHACDLDRHHHLVGQLVVRSHFPVDHTTK